jgi:hypothetical protein
MEAERVVKGIVMEQCEFGVFVDIGEAERALVVITMLEDEPRATRPQQPVLGQEVEVVLLGYSGPGRQNSPQLEAARPRGHPAELSPLN